MRFKLFWVGILFAGLSLSSCGKKGPLTSGGTDLSLQGAPVAAKRALGSNQKKSVNFAKRLGLTETQRAEFGKLRKDQADAIKALRADVKNGVKDKESAKAALAEIKATFEAGLDALLSDEQLKTYKDLQAKLAKQKARVQKQKRKSSPFRRLNLTDEQKAQIRDLNKTKAEQGKAIREAVKAGTQDKAGAKADYARIKEAYDAGLAGILSAEQLAGYKKAQAKLAKQKARVQKQKKKQSKKRKAPASGSGDAQG